MSPAVTGQRKFGCRSTAVYDSFRPAELAVRACDPPSATAHSAYSRGEMLAYDQFWDRMSREASLENDRSKIEAAKTELAETTAKLNAATAERDAATARADAATAERDAATAECDAAIEKLHQTVRQMRTGGMALEMIAKFTGLTSAEIDGIR